VLAEVPQLGENGFEVVLTASPQIDALTLEVDRVRVDYVVGEGLLLGGRLISHSTYSDLFLAFNADLGIRIEYEDLEFGYVFEQPGAVIEDSWPRPNERFISSDQVYLTPVRLQHQPDTESRLVVWLRNAGQEYRAELSFLTLPLPFADDID
jgi:hypothetical protein